MAIVASNVLPLARVATNANGPVTFEAQHPAVEWEAEEGRWASCKASLPKCCACFVNLPRWMVESGALEALYGESIERLKRLLVTIRALEAVDEGGSIRLRR